MENAEWFGSKHWTVPHAREGKGGIRIRVPTLPPLKDSSVQLRNLKDRSFVCEGARLFNSLPSWLKAEKGSLDTFKRKLDGLLSCVPDQPATPSLTPGATSMSGSPSNCLLDWMRSCKFPDDDPSNIGVD